MTMVVLFCLLVFTSSSAFALTFSKLVVFGDSLSDNGNIYALSYGTVPASEHAYDGRYSDGPVWVEYLAQYLSAGLVDLAQCGAKTGTNTDIPVGLKAQVADFTGLIASYPALGSDDTLYVVWAGPNDFLDGSTDYETAAQNIGDALDTLAAAGAKYIIVPNMPNLGATPRMQAQGQAQVAGAQLLSRGFNAALDGVVTSFSRSNPEVTVYNLDIYTMLETIQADSVTYGFTDVTNRYVNDDDTLNNDGNSYFFWDDIHPTTKAHKVIAEVVATQIDADSAAWFTDAGVLNIPQVFVNGHTDNYNATLQYVGPITGAPEGNYFKLGTLSDNNGSSL